MKKKHLIFVVFLCVLLTGLLLRCCSSAHRIGVVDMSQVYANAAVFQSIRSEQQSFEQEWKTQALAKKEELEKADKALSRKKGSMRRAKFDKEVAALKDKILDFQNQQMARLDLIRYQSGQIMQQVEEMMQPMIAQLADKKDLHFVLSASNVMYHTKAIDITSDVVRLLDDAFEAGNLPSLQISFNEGE